MAKENTKVMAAKPAKAAPAAKPQKTPNPESFFNRFAKPVGKLGLVGALTAGSIGLVNELTKDAIATNIYNQKVSAYKESGSLLEDWTFNGKDKLEANYGLYGTANEAFGIFEIANVSSKDLPSTPLVKEVMVYCEEAVGEDCNADADPVGYGFLAERAVDTYGTMSLLVVTDVDGVIIDYNQLGFVTSFSGETAMMDKAMKALVGEKISSADYGTAADIAGASVPASVGAVSAIMTEMSSMHATIALDPHTAVSDIMGTMVGNSPSTNRITATSDMFTSEDITQATSITDVEYIVELNDGGFMFILSYTGYNPRTIIAQTDSAGADFKWTMNSNYFTSDGYDDVAEAEAISWLNGITDITSIGSTGISGSTTNTDESMEKLSTAFTAAWGGRN